MAEAATGPDLAELYRRLGAAFDKEAENGEQSRNNGPS